MFIYKHIQYIYTCLNVYKSINMYKARVCSNNELAISQII